MATYVKRICRCAPRARLGNTCAAGVTPMGDHCRFVFERVFGDLLEAELDEEQLNVGFWNGSLELRDVQLNVQVRRATTLCWQRSGGAHFASGRRQCSRPHIGAPR